jgi:hypothetical protein
MFWGSENKRLLIVIVNRSILLTEVITLTPGVAACKRIVSITTNYIINYYSRIAQKKTPIKLITGV